MSWASLPYEYGRHRPVTGPKPADSAERVAGDAAAFKARQAEAAEQERGRDEARRRAATERTIAHNRAVMIREYTSRGLTPAYSDPGETMPISLPFLLQLGWHVETDGMGRSWLVRPEPIGTVVDRGIGEGQQR